MPFWAAEKQRGVMVRLSCVTEKYNVVTCCNKRPRPDIAAQRSQGPGIDVRAAHARGRARSPKRS